MATDADYNKLIRLVGPELLTETQFREILDDHDASINAAAAEVWEIRAGKYHSLVNISESGSSRNMGDLQKQALAMATAYRARLIDEDGDGLPDTTGRTRIGRIVRA